MDYPSFTRLAVDRAERQAVKRMRERAGDKLSCRRVDSAIRYEYEGRCSEALLAVAPLADQRLSFVLGFILVWKMLSARSAILWCI